MRLHDLQSEVAALFHDALAAALDEVVEASCEG